MPVENVSHEALERALDRATPTDVKGKCKEPEAAMHEQTQSSISMMLAQQAGPSSRQREKSRAAKERRVEPMRTMMTTR